MIMMRREGLWDYGSEVFEGCGVGGLLRFVVLGEEVMGGGRRFVWRRLGGEFLIVGLGCWGV
jgi:hypothetical protein